MRALASCLERHEFAHTKFQSSVCWLLLLGALFAMIPPIIVVVQQQSNSGCQGTEFVVYAHYSTHEWLTEQFNRFKESHSEEWPDACFELRIEDSALDLGSYNEKSGKYDIMPTIWIPETDIWIDIAEAEYGELIANRSGDCSSLSLVPFGLITWSKFASLLSPDGEPITFSPDITSLADEDWAYINEDTSETIEDYFPETFDNTSAFFFGHGHPNVSSGGLLGFVTAISSLQGMSPGDVYVALPDCSEEGDNYDNQVTKPLTTIAQRTVATAPIDYTLPSFMMSRGPLYLHMAYGFESDVALFNHKYKDRMSYLWNDTLAFLYLTKTYWVEHPMCILTGASWYDKDGDMAAIAKSFVHWIVRDCDDCIPSLQKYGLRPHPQYTFNKTSNTSLTSIITPANGCNPNITVEQSSEFAAPSVVTANCIKQQYGEIKKKLKLYVLLETSQMMQEGIVGGEKTRWSGVIAALPVLANNLADSAQINTTCFSKELGSCSNTNSYPNGTLRTARADLISYYENHLSATETEHVHLFSALSELYREVQTVKAGNEGYRYVILVISGEEVDTESGYDSENEANALFDTVGLAISDPNEIHIYTILYYGKDQTLSARVLEDIATRTNGQHAHTNAESLADAVGEFTYYW